MNTRTARHFLRTLALCSFCAVPPTGCSGDAHEPAPSHELRADGNVVLSGESMSYVRVEPAGEPPPTATRTLFARVSFDETKLEVLGSLVNGRVASVDVVVGDHVEPGQVLLTIHSTDVASAQAAVAEAIQQRQLAEQSAARAQQLVTSGAGSQAEAQQATTALANARLEEQRASQAVRVLGGARGSDLELRAGRAGTVVERNVQVGNAVAADSGQPLIKIADLSTVWVLADVYEPDLPFVDAGDDARVLVQSLPDGNFTGRIATVSSVVDPLTRTAPARVVLDNAAGRLRPGMFAQVEVESAETAVAQVPTSAVLARRDEFYVFIQQHDRSFKQQIVTLGPARGEHVAILTGLRPGDPVATRGAILLDAEANAAF